MRRFVTRAFFVALAAFTAAPVMAQVCPGTEGQDYFDVTVREINQIPQDNIDQLSNGGASLDIATIQSLLTNELEGELVQFTAVFLTDPLLSGLASLNNEDIPNRIHVFVRDVNAADMGAEGMGIQIVDGTGDGAIQGFFPGDEVTVCGTVSPFSGSGGKAMQISPISGGYLGTGNTYAEDDPIRQPMVVTTDDFHKTLADGNTQIRWENYSDYNGQYVRLEGASLVQGTAGARPNMLISSPTQDTQVNSYDTSVCYRNDRGSDYYPPTTTLPACLEDDFLPPPQGTVNIQGFLSFQGDDGAFGYSTPTGANFVINPFEEADFEVTQAPPAISTNGPDFVPTSGDAVTITADVIPSNEATVSEVTLDYTYELNGTSGSVTMTNTGGDTYEGEIPAGPNTSFVSYTVTATDDGGLTTTSDVQAYRIFDGVVNSIRLIQETFDGGPGPSPIATGEPTDFDLMAIVQSSFQSGDNYLATIQDNAELAPFTGVWIFFGSSDPDLIPGDVVNITEATITENFGLTQLTDVTFSKQGPSVPLSYKTVTTDLFNGDDGDAVAEQHEGMLLTFSEVEVTATNADAPIGPFGEFAFSSDGTAANALRADDYSNAIEYEGNDPGSAYEVGDMISYIRGAMYYSFDNYKLVPITTDDIGKVTVANEQRPGEVTGTQVRRAYPNPTAGEAVIEYEVAAPGPVSLRIYDVTGREVTTLVNRTLSPSVYEATFDTAGLANGLYIYRLEAGDTVSSGRLSVIR